MEKREKEVKNDIPETEQWLLDGDCRKCRKLSYCGGECKKHEQAFLRAFDELMREKGLKL